MWKGHSGLRLEWLGPWSQENQGYEVLLTSAIKGRMWVKQCHKPPIWEWFIISNYLWWFRGWLIIVVPTLVSLVSLVEWSVFWHSQFWSSGTPRPAAGIPNQFVNWVVSIHGIPQSMGLHHATWNGKDILYHLISRHQLETSKYFHDPHQCCTGPYV